MTKDEIEYIVLILLSAIFSIWYCIIVIISERKKMKYYCSILLYETDWDKYSTMVKKQKRIIFKKRVYLCYLKFLVKLKELFKWKM